MGVYSRIDYGIFLGLCDNSVSLKEMLDAIEYAEACEMEERRTLARIEANDIINTLN